MAKNYSDKALNYFDGVLSDVNTTAAQKQAAAKSILNFKTITSRHRKTVSDLRKRLAEAKTRISELENLLDIKESADAVPMVGRN